MKDLGTLLLSKEPFSEIVIGNTAIVRAMIEAGTRVITSYPGSPTPEIASAIAAIPAEKRPFYFEFSTNEKVAMEVAYGAAINGHAATVFFKSVGLNVAADMFMQLALTEVLGGLVIVVGDDPGAHSSQNEQDNRFYAKMGCVAMLEPATPGEIYHFYKEAMNLARKNRTPILLRLSTHSCHQKEKVDFMGYRPLPMDWTPRFDVKYGPYIPVPSAVAGMKRRALDKLEKMRDFAGNCTLNRVDDFKNPRQGIITAGVPYLSVMDVLSAHRPKSSKNPNPDVLKLGVVYPLPRNPIRAFLQNHNEVHIIEELDDILEKEIKTIAYEEGIQVKISGKTSPDDWIGEYTPDKVAAILSRRWPDTFKPTDLPVESGPFAPVRPPQLCPGCGHRSAFYAIQEVLNESDITVSDIGCYTLGFLPPHHVGQLLMCMGASLGMASGLSLFNTSRRVVAFIGDSTLFHAGLPGAVNAVFNRHRFTLVVMNNATTAMTGHQDHPASGRNFNRETEKIPIRRALEGLGITKIYEADAYQQKKLRDIFSAALADETVNAVIATHPCMLQFTRRQRKKPEFRPRRVRIDPENCSRQHECIGAFGCPSFIRDDHDDILVHPDLCIGDGSCIQTCPVQAIGPEKPPASKSGEKQ